MATFTPTNWYQNITSLVNSLPYRKYLSPAHLGQATSDGEIKGIPFTADVSVLYWNKTLFSRAGLTPTTRRLTGHRSPPTPPKIRTLGGNTYGYFFSGACAGCMAFTMLPYVWAQGGNILKENSPVGMLTLYPNIRPRPCSPSHPASYGRAGRGRRRPRPRTAPTSSACSLTGR